MALHAREQLVALRAKRHVEHRVEREHLKMIVMRRVPHGRPGTQVAHGAATRPALQHPFGVGQTLLLLQPFG